MTGGALLAAGGGPGEMASSFVQDSVRLGSAFDLRAAYRPFATPAPSLFFERAGLGVAGVASLRIDVAGGPGRFERAGSVVAAAFRRVRVESGGPDPVVAGAFPFDEGGDPRLFLLTRAVVRLDPGETYRVSLRPGEAEPIPGPDGGGESLPEIGAPRDSFGQDQITADPSPDAYARAVAQAVDRIRSGSLRKVVLARSLVLDAGRLLDYRSLLKRLRAVDPGCYTFAVPTGSGSRGALIGATPELLVSRRGLEVRAVPLAGSAPRSGDAGRDRSNAERLLSSHKEREEHAIVVEAVEAALEPFCDRLDHDREPYPLGTANVWHLATSFRATLREPAPSVLELAGALHPTPAVCGSPRDAASEAIGELESIDRGCYAGPVGWVDARGNGEWALALRCAQIDARRARLFAGAGIVADSDPAAELEETEAKFRALLDSLRWG